MLVRALNQTKVALVFRHYCNLVLPFTCLMILSILTFATLPRLGLVGLISLVYVLFMKSGL